MPQGDKSAYTDKQKRKAEHIEQGYEDRGVAKDEAERRAWATVNKDDGGGNKSGAGRGTHTGHPAAHKGGRKGGAASASRPAAERSAEASDNSNACSTLRSGKPSISRMRPEKTFFLPFFSTVSSPCLIA